jgi:hypothetical protein
MLSTDAGRGVAHAVTGPFSPMIDLLGMLAEGIADQAFDGVFATAKAELALSPLRPVFLHVTHWISHGSSSRAAWNVSWPGSRVATPRRRRLNPNAAP